VAKALGRSRKNRGGRNPHEGNSGIQVSVRMLAPPRGFEPRFSDILRHSRRSASIFKYASCKRDQWSEVVPTVCKAPGAPSVPE
jgi:hypothetical protein